jgi:hypothetical protein
MCFWRIVCSRNQNHRNLVGTIKIHIDIGQFTFDIYGWLEDQWGIREYILMAAPEDFDLNSKPMFIVRVPFENNLQCANDVTELLNTLRIKESTRDESH